jgi:hypothetical protein
MAQINDDTIANIAGVLTLGASLKTACDYLGLRAEDVETHLATDEYHQQTIRKAYAAFEINALHGIWRHSNDTASIRCLQWMLEKLRRDTYEATARGEEPRKAAAHALELFIGALYERLPATFHEEIEDALNACLGALSTDGRGVLGNEGTLPGAVGK